MAAFGQRSKIDQIWPHKSHLGPALGSRSSDSDKIWHRQTMILFLETSLWKIFIIPKSKMAAAIAENYEISHNLKKIFTITLYDHNNYPKIQNGRYLGQNLLLFARRHTLVGATKFKFLVLFRIDLLFFQNTFFFPILGQSKVSRACYRLAPPFSKHLVKM